MRAWIDPFTHRAIETWPKGNGGAAKHIRKPRARRRAGSPLKPDDLQQFVAAGFRVRTGRHETQLSWDVETSPPRRPHVRSR